MTKMHQSDGSTAGAEWFLQQLPDRERVDLAAFGNHLSGRIFVT